MIADEDGRAVLAAAACLPRRQREVLALRYATPGGGLTMAGGPARD